MLKGFSPSRSSPSHAAVASPEPWRHSSDIRCVERRADLIASPLLEPPCMAAGYASGVFQ